MYSSAMSQGTVLTLLSSKRRVERFQDANISEHDHYGGGSIMAWAGIMTRVRYRDEILDVYVRLYAGGNGP